MNHPAYGSCRTHALAAAILATLLAGCGAGSESERAGQPGDSVAYADTLAYCGSQEPGGAAAQPGGWVLSSPQMHTGSPTYDVSSIVSPAGSAATASPPVRLQIDARDYRGVTGPLLLPGYADPQWKMGVSFLPVLPPNSAACTVSLAKLTAAAGTPGRYMLAWTSKWSASVSFAGVPGTVIDGFEFVSTFTPADAQVFFFLPKSRTPTAQSLSLCYLAPMAGSWDCSAPAVSDAGTVWAVSRQGAKQGVYVVTAS